MICSRCGSGCPTRENGMCFHCTVAVDIEKKLGRTLKDSGVNEGFPDWKKPQKGDKKP